MLFHGGFADAKDNRDVAIGFSLRQLRTAALADGLRKSHREGDIRDREYARQVQEITQEAAG